MSCRKRESWGKIKLGENKVVGILDGTRGVVG